MQERGWYIKEIQKAHTAEEQKVKTEKKKFD